MKQFSFYIHLFILLLLMQPTTLVGQSLFHQDIFYGGVTSGGFSTGEGFGSGTLPLYIEPGSTIRKAYLFSYRIGYPPKAPITVNGTPFFIDTNNIVMQVNHTNPFASPIHFYYEDITNYLTTNFTSTFNITIPTQFGLPIGWGWFTAFIYIEYDNLALPKVATSLWINDKDLIGNEAYVMNNMNPMNTNFPVGLAVMIDRACNNTTDGTAVNLNSNLIGIIGNPDVVNNNWNCAGSKGHFYYQNNTLFGLDDDIPNNIMDSSDALANITSYLTNGDTGYSLNLIHNNNNNIGKPNVNLLFINAYTTPCDTFSTSVTAIKDTICVGESVQLQATGGSTYNWLGELNDTSIANPIASPTQSTTYIVTIQNDSGCVKTEHIKIWVNPLPTPSNIITTNTLCNDSSGNLTVGIINSNTAPYSYTLTNLETSNTIIQAQNTFSNLGNAIYLLQIMDINGCSVTDTILINDVQVGCDALDTLELIITIPNVFTPNGDNENDNFVIQIIGAELLESIEMVVFNRWGQKVENRKLKGESIVESRIVIWNGTTTAGNKASEGTYFYLIKYTTKTGETTAKKGTITLLR